MVRGTKLVSAAVLGVLVLVLALPASGQCKVDEVMLPPADVNERVATIEVSGDWMFVGTTDDDDVADEAGAVQVFRRVGGSWTHFQKIAPTSLPASAHFGDAVAADGDFAFFGCDECADFPESGRVYVYRFDGVAWNEVDVLTLAGVVGQPFFGTAVAADGGTLLVGSDHEGFSTPFSSEGAVHVYENQGGVWTEVQVLRASDKVNGDAFGARVDIDGDTLLVGAPEQGLLESTGAAYVFERSGGAWNETAKLEDDGLVEHADFGDGLALEGDVAAVSVPRAEVDGGVVNRGLVYLYERDGGGWSEVDVLCSPLAGAQQIGYFAQEISLHGGRLVVAEFEGSLLSPTTRQWIFERAQSGWEEVDLLDTDVSPLGAFRTVQGFSGDSLVLLSVGSPAGVFSFVDLPPAVTATGSPTSLSLAVGGTQTLSLDLGSCLAGQVHFLLGSATGTSPGVTFQGFELPLVPDAYTGFTQANPNAGPYTDTLGFLDADGSADPRIDLPVGLDPALAGTTLFHAAIVFDPTTLEWQAVTDPTELELVP